MDIEEALEAEHCGACARNCPLSSPLCGAGRAMADDLVFALTGERPNEDTGEIHFDHSGRFEDIDEWHPHA
ncbi:MAG: hypothetical protein V8R08_00455 [Coriobacteriales bacterium]